MLNVRNLSVSYDQKTAVRDVTISFEPGVISGLVGPNGAGKSTLLKTCAGILTEYEGAILLDGNNIRDDLYGLKSACGYSPEDAVLPPYLTGREFLQLIAAVRKLNESDEQIAQIQRLLGLENQSDELIINYSHGMMQKTSLAAALLGAPHLLLIDETINGLDAAALFRLRRHLEHLAQLGHIVVLASHVLPLVRDWCHTVAVMHQGRIIARLSKQEIRTIEQKQSTTFEEYFMKLTAG